MPSANDIVDGSVAVSCGPASGSSFSLGPTTVTCTASDAHGNKATTTLTVTVVDTTGPAFSNVPSGLTVEANGPGGSRVNYASPTANDLVDGPVPVSCGPSSGSTFPLGTTTVTCNATDAHGNRGSTSFAVHVVDTTPPVLTIPAPITVYTTSQTGCLLPCSPVARWANSATATDIVDPSPKITTTGLPDLIPLGVNPVDFVATDAAGNRASAISTVTVVYDAGGTFTPPTPPAHVTPPPNVTGLSAKVGNGFVLLTWSNPSAADHIVVYRSLPTDTGVGSPIYTGSASQFRDSGLQNDTQYRYVVVTYDKAGNRSAGVAILATPTMPKLIAPADGAIVKKPPVLQWAGQSGVDYWNVQLFMDTQLTLTSDFSTNSVRVLSAWPTSTRLVLHKRWRYNGHTYRLKHGIYRWFVWPGYGARSANKYGPLLGQSTFVVR
jgi:chitodextrinase